MQTIPIVFAINDNFVPYCGVAISSLIANSSKEYMYKVYIFYTEMAEANIRRIEALSTSNVAVKCVDVSDYIPDMTLKNKNHVSKETMYRIIAPSVLKEYDKLLYLDSDIVILHDVAELYQTDINNYSLGAVETASIMSDNFIRYLSERNLQTAGYFNSGVLLLNTKKLLRENVLDKVVKALDTNLVYSYPDQDTLNIVCKGDIFYLPYKWNVEWHIIYSDEDSIKKQAEKVEELKKEMYILHFTSGKKAWNCLDRELADKFWMYAKQTPFFGEIVYNNLPKALNQPNLFKRFMFPWESAKCDARIIIYGAGAVGRAYLSQLSLTNYCDVVAVADKNRDVITGLGVKVILPVEIKNFVYDKILIAIENESVAEEIRQDLIDMGYDNDLIEWMSPAINR